MSKSLSNFVISRVEISLQMFTNVSKREPAQPMQPTPAGPPAPTQQLARRLSHLTHSFILGENFSFGRSRVGKTSLNSSFDHQGE